jgi:aminopeptidase N
MSVSPLPRGARVAAPKRRADYRPPAFAVDDVDIEFDLDPDVTHVSTTFRFRRNPAVPGADANAPLVLDGEHQQDVRVTLDGRALPPQRVDVGASALTLADAPDAGTLNIRSTIAPSRNASLEGLYVSSDVLCTQCEPEGFRRITYFPDRPDVLASYTVTLRAPQRRYPTLLSNGNPVAAGTLGGGRHFVTWRDPFPKPTYLFALVAGDLATLDDAFVTASGRSVALKIFSTAANLPRCRHAMDSLKRAMRWDEQRFGREYDLDTFMIFCADDFNFGAMENKGLNIFNSRLLLADPQTATDDDFKSIESVVAHEYFHNWTGNRITCRDWFQLSLKEGLTVFRDQEFSSDQGSRTVERIAAVEFLRREQFAEDAGPMMHPVRPDEYQEINNFYTATVYEKGAELIRMQHTLLGPERFRSGMDLYFERHDGQAVTCDDFVQAMQDASGVDLSRFRRWYSQPGTPVVAIRARYDAAARTYALDVEQTAPPSLGNDPPQPLHIPMAIGLLAADGSDIPLRACGEPDARGTTRILELTSSSQRFAFVDIDGPPVPSLFRGFSAPVRVDFDYDDGALALLASHDSDPVNRWDAAQRLFIRSVLRVAHAHREGRTPEASPLLTQIVVRLLTDEEADPALRALAIEPPDAAYVATLEPVIDPDSIVAAFALVERALATTLRHEFEAAYRRHRPPAADPATPAAASSRRLANACLRYVASLDDDRSRALAVAQFDAADNMTDSIAALAALRDSVSPARADLYARFERSWRDEPLVLDKWFTLQARSQRPDTLDTVKALAAHPRFNVRNPNRVRSLVGAFALRNFAAFNAADGAGYAFAATQVVTLDPMNPQLASTIAGAFNLWKRYAQPRRTLMRRCLERIADTPGLSPDVAEIVTRTLA